MTLRELYEQCLGFEILGIYLNMYAVSSTGEPQECMWGQFGEDGDDNNGSVVQVEEDGTIRSFFLGNQIYRHSGEPFDVNGLIRAIYAVAAVSGHKIPDPTQIVPRLSIRQPRNWQA
jgi:hypothetical protein